MLLLAVRLCAALVLLVSLVTGVQGVRLLLADRLLDQRAGITEGLVTAVRDSVLRDRVVVSLDELDGREITVTKVGEPEVGQRLAVQYDPEGPATGRVSGSDRDRRDGLIAAVGGAAVAVLTAALAPWRRRRSVRP